MKTYPTKGKHVPGARRVRCTANGLYDLIRLTRALTEEYSWWLMSRYEGEHYPTPVSLETTTYDPQENQDGR